MNASEGEWLARGASRDQVQRRVVPEEIVRSEMPDIQKVD